MFFFGEITEFASNQWLSLISLLIALRFKEARTKNDFANGKKCDDPFTAVIKFSL